MQKNKNHGVVNIVCHFFCGQMATMLGLGTFKTQYRLTIIFWDICLVRRWLATIS